MSWEDLERFDQSGL